MAGLIETNGLSDKVLYSQVMTNLKGAYANYGVGDGNYPKAEGILTDRILENIWMKNILDARIFADGMGVTSRTGDARASSIRVPIMAPPRYSMRTISIDACLNGKLQGTPGNDGLENRNLPNVVQTNGVEIPLNQLYDDATIIYELSQDMVSLPIAAEYTSMIPGTVANMEDTTILATHLKGALARAAESENSNVIPVDLSNTTEGYLQQVMNSLIGAMTNPQTTWSEGIVQYRLEDSIIVMKQSFFNRLFSVRNGALVSASNLAQEMLLGGAFTSDGKPKGGNIRGMYSGVWIKVVPDSYWRQAAALIGITSENYPQYDKIQAYIANARGFGFVRARATINPIPNPGNAIGTKIQNLFRWGAAMTRGSAVGVVIATENNLADFTNPVDEYGNLVAPDSFNDVIKSYGFKADYGDASKIGVYEGNNTTTVTLTVNGGESTPLTNASLTITKGDGNLSGYVNNANGTYTFILGRGETASVAVTAQGYAPATVAITAANTAAATYSVTQTLTAATRSKRTQQSTEQSTESSESK